ncbi:MAG: TIGR03013 family PEP-CTERM/XrtA system glycosyltransferase [Colwellia sp.]
MAAIKVFNNYLRIPFILLGFFEAIIFLSAVYSAALVRFQETNFEYTNIIINYSGIDISLIASIYTAVMMLSMTALGQYQSQQHLTPSIFNETVLRVSISLLLGSLGLMILYYIFPQIYMGRGFHLIAVLLSFVGIILMRAIFFQLIDKDILKRNVLVVGAGTRAKMLINEKGGSQDGVSYRLMGYLPIQRESIEVPKHKVIEINIDGLFEFSQKNQVNEIILAIEDRRKSYPDEELLKCKLAGIKIIDPVTFLEREQGKVNLEMLHSSWMIYSTGFTRNEIKGFFSRVFDILSSLIMLLVMLPILLVSAFLISAESGFRQPVFYRQSRVGVDGKEFTLLKFRSMKVDAEKNGKAVWANKNDKRITAVGKFIRKTRIDELPQIINILKGDMRLVGPRPERPEFVEELAKKIPYYKKRHTVKPGLAGWAQLKYPYGANEKDAYEKLQYDLYYVKNHNVIMDFFILLQTIEIVIMGKGAR